MFLVENTVILDSTFVDGVAEGKCRIDWNKTASFEGTLVRGMMEGSGFFGAFNGKLYIHQSIVHLSFQ